MRRACRPSSKTATHSELGRPRRIAATADVQENSISRNACARQPPGQAHLPFLRFPTLLLAFPAAREVLRSRPPNPVEDGGRARLAGPTSSSRTTRPSSTSGNHAKADAGRLITSRWYASTSTGTLNSSPCVRLSEDSARAHIALDAGVAGTPTQSIPPVGSTATTDASTRSRSRGAGTEAQTAAEMSGSVL
eukprot:scaffold26157_cov25-Tisochrysis_lutea.AAC.1